MSNYESQQLVASLFRAFKAEAKRARAGQDKDVAKLRAALKRRMRGEVVGNPSWGDGRE